MLDEKQIKYLLVKTLKNQLTKEDIVIDELGIIKDNTIADIVILTKNNLYGIEIKSDKDNLLRIEKQLKDYHKVFDYVIVCSTEKYKEKLSTISNNLWCSAKDIKLTDLSYNKTHKNYWKLEILWKPELQYWNSLYGLSKYKNKKELISQLLTIKEIDINYIVYKSISERITWKKNLLNFV